MTADRKARGRVTPERVASLAAVAVDGMGPTTAIDAEAARRLVEAAISAALASDRGVRSSPGRSDLVYRPNPFDDWGFIRTSNGDLFACVSRPFSDEEGARHRRDGTDPFEELALQLVDAVQAPPVAPRYAGRAAYARALDVADRLIERAYGSDMPPEWDDAFAAVQRAVARGDRRT